MNCITAYFSKLLSAMIIYHCWTVGISKWIPHIKYNYVLCNNHNNSLVVPLGCLNYIHNMLWSTYSSWLSTLVLLVFTEICSDWRWTDDLSQGISKIKFLLWQKLRWSLRLLYIYIYIYIYIHTPSAMLQFNVVSVCLYIRRLCTSHT